MKNKHAQAMGKLGGKARAAKLTKDERSAIALKAVQTRWKDHIKPKPQSNENQ